MALATLLCPLYSVPSGSSPAKHYFEATACVTRLLPLSVDAFVPCTAASAYFALQYSMTHRRQPKLGIMMIIMTTAQVFEPSLRIATVGQRPGPTVGHTIGSGRGAGPRIATILTRFPSLCIPKNHDMFGRACPLPSELLFRQQATELFALCVYL